MNWGTARGGSIVNEWSLASVIGWTDSLAKYSLAVPRYADNDKRGRSRR